MFMQSTFVGCNGIPRITADYFRSEGAAVKMFVHYLLLQSVCLEFIDVMSHLGEVG